MSTYLQYAKIPYSNKIEPYRIIFIMDGSGSMGRFYPTMIEVYKKIFTGINYVQAFQFACKVGAIDENCGATTNIQIAIERLTEILENEVNETNICVVFVSDGCGEENVENLQARYEIIKQKFQIIFISVAVGNGFPTALSTKLRQMIHNGRSTIPSILPVNSNEQFQNAFDKVQQLAIQQKSITIKNQVLRYPWCLPTNQVYPGEVVAVNDNQNQILDQNNKQLNVPNLTISFTQQFIDSSLQQLIELCAVDKQSNGQNIQKMIEYIYAVRKIMEDKRTIHKIALYVDLGKAILFLEDIKSERLNLRNIGDQKLKEIIVNYTPDKNQRVDSKETETCQKLIKEAEKVGPVRNLLEQIFTIDNKNILVTEKQIEQRLIKFEELCQGSQQLIQLIQNHKKLVYQIIDSHMLFKIDQQK